MQARKKYIGRGGMQIVAVPLRTWIPGANSPSINSYIVCLVVCYLPLKITLFIFQTFLSLKEYFRWYLLSELWCYL